jgi:hypothetical protein
MIIVAAMADMANHAKEPWLSLETAAWLFDRAGFVLVASLVVGVVSTVLIVFTGIEKEHHWDLLRERANEKIASVELEAAKSNAEAAKAHERIAALNNETARMQSDNLALQTSLLPRHIGLTALDKPAPAGDWFAGIKPFAGMSLSISTTDDKEARNLAAEIEMVATRFGWKVTNLGWPRSNLDSSKIPDGLSVSYQIGKPWIAGEPNQPWFEWAKAAEALADALTKAGLAVGDRRVSRFGFTNEKPEVWGLTAHFDPPLEGIFLQVGARPVAETIEWIKQGRPDVQGNKPAVAGPAAPHK